MSVNRRFAGLLRAALGRGACLALACVLLAPASGHGTVVQRITAVVNDEIISAYDLQQRMRLVISSAGLNPTPDVVSRIEQQVLRSLVDERLQLQEAKREDITVDDFEIEQALTNLAQQNNMSANEIRSMLQHSAVDFSTLKDQIRAEIAWSKLVGRRFGGRVVISDDQVETEYNRAVQSFSKPQYLLSEIVLRVEQPEQDDEVRRTAQRLIDELRQGASFPVLARQFSQSSTSGLGGDLGWMERDQLDPALQTALDHMSPGQLSPPVRTVRGYHIVVLRNRRDASGEEGAALTTGATLKALLLPLDAKADEAAAEAAMDRVHAAGEKLKGCTNVAAVAASEPGMTALDLGHLSINQVTEPLRQIVANLEAGEVSPPFRGAGGAQVLVVCSRDMETTKTPLTPPTREEIQARLYNQQISMMARRYLRDLRRDAVVEYR
jgi:peptidyl-prolyl cis-trans isomerase SurA